MAFAARSSLVVLSFAPLASASSSRLDRAANPRRINPAIYSLTGPNGWLGTGGFDPDDNKINHFIPCGFFLHRDILHRVSDGGGDGSNLIGSGPFATLPS